MSRNRKYGLIVMAMLLCLSMAVFTGCQYSATHESETSFNISTGEESGSDADDQPDTPLAQACASIDDYLNEDWPDSYNISYTEDDGSEDANTIFVLFWKNGIQSIDNIDQLIEYMDEYNETFRAMMEDAGVTDGHIELEILVGVEDEDSYKNGSCVLEVRDGEIVYNAYAEQ